MTDIGSLLLFLAMLALLSLLDAHARAQQRRGGRAVGLKFGGARSRVPRVRISADLTSPSLPPIRCFDRGAIPLCSSPCLFALLACLLAC